MTQVKYLDIDFLLMTKLNILVNFYDIKFNNLMTSESFSLNIDYNNMDHNTSGRITSIHSYFSTLFTFNTMNKNFIDLESNDTIDDLIVFLMRFFYFRLYLIFKPKQNNIIFKINEQELLIINWIYVYSQKINLLTSVNQKSSIKNIVGLFFLSFYSFERKNPENFTPEQIYFSSRIRSMFKDLLIKKQIWFERPFECFNSNSDDMIEYFNFYANYVDKDFFLLPSIIQLNKNKEKNLVKISRYVFEANQVRYFTFFSTEPIKTVHVNDKIVNVEIKNQFLILNNYEIKSLKINGIECNTEFVFVKVENHNNNRNKISKMHNKYNISNTNSEYKQFIHKILKYSHQFSFNKHLNIEIIKNSTIDLKNIKSQLQKSKTKISCLNHVFYAPDNNRIHVDISFCCNILNTIPIQLYRKIQHDKNIEMLKLFYKTNDSSVIYNTELINDEDFQNFELYRLLGFRLNSCKLFEQTNPNIDFNMKNSFDLIKLVNFPNAKKHVNFVLDMFTLNSYTNLLIFDFDFCFEIIQLNETRLAISVQLVYKSIFWSDLLTKSDTNAEHLFLEIDILDTSEKKSILKKIFQNSSEIDGTFYRNWLTFLDCNYTILTSKSIEYKDFLFRLFKTNNTNLDLQKNNFNRVPEKYLIIFEPTKNFSLITDYCVQLKLFDSFENNLLFNFKAR